MKILSAATTRKISCVAIFGISATLADLSFASPTTGQGPAPQANYSHHPHHPHPPHHPPPKPDLIADFPSWQFVIRTQNIGTGASPGSVTQVMCFTNTAPSKPCVEGKHFVTLPGVMPPQGTTKVASNAWNVPIPGLAAGGFTTFGLNIKTVPALQQTGLQFQVCADVFSTIDESNEDNNCQWVVYNWPN